LRYDLFLMTTQIGLEHHATSFKDRAACDLRNERYEIAKMKRAHDSGIPEETIIFLQNQAHACLWSLVEKSTCDTSLKEDLES